MVTDDEVRILLHRAADTIEVGPGEPLPSVAPRPRWPLLVAAAAVLAVTIGSVVLTHGEGGDPTPSAPSGEPVEQPEVLDPDQIPSVLGFDVAEATELLRAKGLRVEVREVREHCQVPGIVSGTEPSLGARFRPGQTVRVFVFAEVQVIDCIGEPLWPQIWGLVRFARGLAGPPELAEELILYVDDGDPATISREQAADPNAWTLCSGGECHSALAAIEQMATRTWTMNRRHYRGRPYLATGQPSGCEHRTPIAGLGQGPSVEVWVTVPMDGAALCPAHSVLLHLDPDTGEIVGAGLNTPEEPDVPREPTTTQRRVADAFLAWARVAKTPPPFADEVQLLVADDAWETVTAGEAADRDRWSMCSGLPPETCGVNPLRVLAEHEHRVAQSRTLTSCGAPDPRHLPDELADTIDDELVRLDQTEPKNCRVAFAVELWITEEGRIRAVNLLP
jgi:hypothetical protein